MRAEKRIILNALATYGRTLLQMGLGLFSSRWVLQSLGVTDYGLMGVVGTLIVLITFLNAVFNGACARFFAFSIGKNDLQDLIKWFNTALSVHVSMAILLIAIGWPIGEWAIDNILNIPPERLETSHWVFRFSLVSAFWTIASTPYMAMFIATQNIVELTLWEIASILTNFFFVYWLTTYTGDAWLMYAGFTVGLAILIGMLKLLRAKHKFAGCKVNISYWGDWIRIKEMFSFSGWTLFGNLGYLARANIPAILLNQFFNPIRFAFVNASYQIGVALATYTQSMSAALLGAFSPQITTLAGADEHEKMVQTSFNASKFGTLLILLIAIPVSLEADYLLVLWLKDPPLLAASFCRLVILQMVFDNITYGHMAGILALGKIKWYQITTGLLCISSAPISWLVLKMGGGPLSVSWTIFGCMVACSIARLLFGRKILQISIISWAKGIFAPLLFVSITAIVAGMTVILLIDNPSFLRLCITTATTMLVTIILSWYLLLNTNNRKAIIGKLSPRLSMMGRMVGRK